MALVLISREEAIDHVCKTLSFPWKFEGKETALALCYGKILADDLKAPCSSPEWNRSTRDGFAVRSADLCGASHSSPVFLNCLGEVPMGSISSIELEPETCAKIHTGGILPKNSDSVLMLEDAAEAAGFIEARRALQSGDNIIFAGEEYEQGETILKTAHIIDFSTVGLLASMGKSMVGIAAPKIGILSTGDEVVPINEAQEGKIRDVNSWVIAAVLEKYGYRSEIYGIVQDDKSLLERKVTEMLNSCDVVLLSGGSSVSERDHTEEVLADAGSIIVKGIRIAPGKPTIIAGSADKKRLMFGLPGHPLSCLTVMLTIVLPLLRAMQTCENKDIFAKLKIRAAKDVFGRTGVEEFIPCRLSGAEAVPMPSKSGYIGVLSSGLIRLPDNVETVRAGDEVEVWLW